MCKRTDGRTDGQWPFQHTKKLFDASDANSQEKRNTESIDRFGLPSPPLSRGHNNQIADHYNRPVKVNMSTQSMGEFVGLGSTEWWEKQNKKKVDPSGFRPSRNPLIPIRQGQTPSKRLIESHEKLPKTKETKKTKLIGWTYLVTGRVGALLKRRFGRLFGRFSLKMIVCSIKSISDSHSQLDKLKLYKAAVHLVTNVFMSFYYNPARMAGGSNREWKAE